MLTKNYRKPSAIMRLPLDAAGTFYLGSLVATRHTDLTLVDLRLSFYVMLRTVFDCALVRCMEGNGR